MENQEKKLFVIDVLSIMIEYNQKYLFCSSFTHNMSPFGSSSSSSTKEKEDYPPHIPVVKPKTSDATKNDVVVSTSRILREIVVSPLCHDFSCFLGRLLRIVS